MAAPVSPLPASSSQQSPTAIASGVSDGPLTLGSPPAHPHLRRASESLATPGSSLARQRRRPPTATGPPNIPNHLSKVGPQRSTKNVQKLKILPSPDEQQDEESGREVYSQVTRIKDTTARRDAERLGKAERARLPRVTAYCTANAYKMDGLMRFLKARAQTRGAQPKQFDECIYTPYSYNYSMDHPTQSDLIDLHERGTSNDDEDDRASVMSIVKSQPATMSEVFLFDYGVVVIWGMNVDEEKKFLKEIARFESEKLSDDDVQVENFNYYITKSYQPRIYNDFITLRDGRNYMIKVAISHAIAQSVKISLFEDLVENTIEETKSIPQDIAMTGKVSMNRRTIMMHIGELFILRININLNGSVLDSPELMWSEPELEPTYAAARSYLEINQRVSLLNQRLDVIGDLLQMLKEQLSHSHGEYLEWIVIILIAAEILVGMVNIAVDILAE